VNRTVVTVIRAVLGLAVLIVLIMVVLGWWRDYKAAPSSLSGSASTEASPTAGEQGSGTSAAGASADETPGQSDTLVVLVDGLDLRAEPSADAKSLRGLNKGERLVLVKKDGDWYRVKTTEGDTGWISANPGYTRVENP